MNNLKSEVAAVKKPALYEVLERLEMVESSYSGMTEELRTRLQHIVGYTEPGIEPEPTHPPENIIESILEVVYKINRDNQMLAACLRHLNEIA